jgi:hypothetical protein
LLACLVRLGWILRGSKNRPEVASQFADDPEVREALHILEETMGLVELNAAAVVELCRRRLQFRTDLVHELEGRVAAAAAAGTMDNLIEREYYKQREHNRLAFDYYQPAVDDGLTKGVVNHIRALSGFASTPVRMAQCLGLDLRFPIRSFILCDAISPQLRHSWLGIAGLYGTRTDAHDWVSRLRHLNNRLLDAGRRAEHTMSPHHTRVKEPSHAIGSSCQFLPSPNRRVQARVVESIAPAE